MPFIPEGCVHPDCFNCKLSDCYLCGVGDESSEINNSVKEAINLQKKREREYEAEIAMEEYWKNRREGKRGRGRPRTRFV